MNKDHKKDQQMKTTMWAVALVLLLAACSGSGNAGIDAGGPSALDGESDTTEVEQASETEQVESDAPADVSRPTDEGGGSPDASPALAGASPVGGFSLYDFRYCELLISVAGDDGATRTEVWGTPGIDPCEDDAWNAIDIDATMAEFGASSIIMNGPRYFVVDGTADTTPAGGGGAGAGVAAGGATEARNFGDVAMRLLATVEDDGTESAAYAADLVVRTTTWTYNAGTEIYELTDLEGNVYVMQSYALIHDQALTTSDLATLGTRLELPEGWTYRARVLDEDLQLGLTPDGALVLQDELANSYQRHG